MVAALAWSERRKQRRKQEAIRLRQSHPTHAICEQFAERHGMELGFNSDRATTWKGMRSGRVLSLSMHDDFVHLQLKPHDHIELWPRFEFQRFENTEGNATTGDPAFDAVVVNHQRIPSEVFAALDADLRKDISSFCDRHEDMRRGGIVGSDGTKVFLRLASWSTTADELIGQWEGLLAHAETIVERMESGNCSTLIDLARDDEHQGVRSEALIRLFSDYAEDHRVVELAQEHLDHSEPTVAGLAALTSGPPGYERLLDLAIDGAWWEAAPVWRRASAIMDAFVANPTPLRGTLGSILLNPGNRELVAPIALGVGESGLDSALDVLLAVAKEMADPDLLAAVVEGIVSLSPEDAEALALRLLTQKQPEKLGIRLIEILESVGGPHAVPVVKTLADGRPKRLSEAAEAALDAIRARLDGVEAGGLALSDGKEGGRLALSQSEGGLAVDGDD